MGPPPHSVTTTRPPPLLSGRYALRRERELLMLDGLARFVGKQYERSGVLAGGGLHRAHRALLAREDQRRLLLDRARRVEQHVRRTRDVQWRSGHTRSRRLMTS